MRAVAVIVAVAIVAALVAAQEHPPNEECVTWIPWTYQQQTPINEVFISGTGWVIQEAFNPEQCIARGDLIPCFSSNANGGAADQTFGHHDYNMPQITNDYCRVYNPSTKQADLTTSFFLPKKGPNYKTWVYKLTQTGATIPSNAIRYKDKVLAMSTVTAPGHCAGKNFGGWAEAVGDGNKFGKVHFAISSDAVTTETFKVAVCKAYHPTTTPAPPSSTPAPTLPPNNKPYIRFAHAVATSHKVTAVITQGDVTATWKCYSFAQFSNWDERFKIGDGQVTIKDCTSGKVLVNRTQLLTPGPLVIAIKGFWPLNQYSIEGIAASYVPAQPGKSGVRLFNLIADLRAAGMDANGKKLVDGVAFTTGSIWAPIPDDEKQKFSAFDAADPTKIIATDEFESPASPFVFTNFALGLMNATKGSAFAPRFIPLLDAPEA